MLDQELLLRQESNGGWFAPITRNATGSTSLTGYLSLLQAQTKTQLRTWTTTWCGPSDRTGEEYIRLHQETVIRKAKQWQQGHL